MIKQVAYIKNTYKQHNFLSKSFKLNNHIRLCIVVHMINMASWNSLKLYIFYCKISWDHCSWLNSNCCFLRYRWVFQLHRLWPWLCLHQHTWSSHLWMSTGVHTNSTRQWTQRGQHLYRYLRTPQEQTWELKNLCMGFTILNTFLQYDREEENKYLGNI